MPAILTLWRLRQEDHEFKAILCYTVRLFQKAKAKTKSRKETILEIL
jgi:hypothetical protein